MRALATTAGKRLDIFPDVPTMGEVGFPGLGLTVWNAIWAPANTPRDIIDRLNAGINVARAMPDVAQRLKELGFTLDGPGDRPEDLAALVKSDIDFWARVVKQANIAQQ